MGFARSPTNATTLISPTNNTTLATILVKIVLPSLPTVIHVLITLEPAQNVTTDSS